MRRFTRLGLNLSLMGLLTGCSGFGHFLGDNFGLQANHNAPIGDSENLRRARGQDVAVPPLLPQPGDVWPGQQPPEPTLSDLQREQNAATPSITGPEARGVAQPVPFPGAGPNPALPSAPVIPQAHPVPHADRKPDVFKTPNGPLKGTTVPESGYQTLTTPKGGNAGIAIPNGNGTSTIIAPDGSVSTVPTPH